MVTQTTLNGRDLVLKGDAEGGEPHIQLQGPAAQRVDEAAGLPGIAFNVLLVKGK